MIEIKQLRRTSAQPRVAQPHRERPLRSPTCTIVAVLWCTQVDGATPLPTEPGYDAITWTMSMRAPPSRGINLADFRVKFEQTPIAAIKAKVGAGLILHHGDASEGAFWLCYTVAEPPRIERLWITSSSEMGGRSHAVTNILAMTLNSLDIPDDCPRLPSQLTPVFLDSKLWLGSTVAELKRYLGKPSHERRSWQSYDFQTKVPSDGKCEGGYDRINSLDAKIRNGIVVAIDAGQVTSC
jgi:hypothetical protein